MGITSLQFLKDRVKYECVSIEDKLTTSTSDGEILYDLIPSLPDIPKEYILNQPKNLSDIILRPLPNSDYLLAFVFDKSNNDIFKGVYKTKI